MAAEKRYLTGDGAMGTAGNWIGETGNIVPIAGDTAIVGSLCAADATDTGAALSTIDLLAMEVHRTYKYSFGTSAAPIVGASGIIKFYSSGPCYYECHLNAGAALNVDKCYVAMARSDAVCELGSVTGDAGEWIDIWLRRGKITLKANIALTAAVLRIGYVSNPASDCNVTIAAGAPTLPTFIQDAGYCKAANVITTAYIGGTLTKTTTKITTAYVMKDGVLNYEHYAIAGDNTVIHVQAGGLLDLMTNEIPKELDDVFVHPGGQIRYDPSLHKFGGTNGLVYMKDEVLP